MFFDLILYCCGEPCETMDVGNFDMMEDGMWRQL